MESMKYDIFNMKSEEVKFNAFFQYLKSFSEAGLDTLQKLQSQFNKEMRSKLKHSETLATIKNLLSSYEIFILEIKDSCDFVEIPEFGYCIGKTFLQLTKMIKWFLKTWLKDSRKYQKLKASIQTEGGKEGDQFQNNKNLCAFCEDVIKTNPYSKDVRGKRRGVAINDIGGDLRQAKKHHLNEMNHLIEFKEHVLQKYTQKQIESKRFISDGNEIDILNRKHVAMKLQISNNQSVLEQVLNQFNLKTEAMARFVSNSQASCIEDLRMNHDSDYSHFEEQMKQVINQKYKEAREKMKALVQFRILQHQKNKRIKQINREVQTMVIEVIEKDQNSVKIKQLISVVQKLKNQLQCQKSLTESLKKLLESKSIQFEQQFLNYRKGVITSDIKSKHILKSLKSFKQIIQQGEQKQNSDKQASIKLDDTSNDLRIKKPTRKMISGLKQKDKSKKRNSIKFTLDDNESVQIDNISLARFSNVQMIHFQPFCGRNQRDCEVQTDPFQCEATIYSVHTSQKKFERINSAIINKQVLKQNRIQKVSSQKINNKKTITQPYSHVKSKVFQQKQNNKTLRKDFKQTRSSCMGNMVKKLSVDYLQLRKQINQPIKLFKIQSQPSFIVLNSFYCSRDDLYNLFICEKNMHNYQCLIFRNSMFNYANLNPKRAVNLSTRIQSSDVEWAFKKQFIVSDSIQGKLTHAIFQQFGAIKRKQRNIYEQMKQLMRSPFELSKKIDIVKLEHHQTLDKDIELGQLKKMINLILRFHCDCVGDQKDVVCEHLIKFCSKIGVKFFKE